ncbi:MAG: 2-oxoglutarate dehydrogenase complex dihydrolipoyllysine-residue succinyltransferase [Candidatus Rariloculaceae bacterium]
MSIEVKVPQLPESVADATVVAWHKRAGDQVRRDENLVDLETDKVVLEVPAPSDGVLKELVIDDGAVVTGGQVLAVLEPGEVTAPEPEAAEPEKDLSEVSPPAVTKDAASERLGPAARRLVDEHGLDAAAIPGSGRDGRISKADVLNYLETRRETSTESVEDSPIAVAPQGGGLGRSEHRVAMTRLRARIAERLVEAQQTAAMLTTFNEVDMSAIMALRGRYKDEFHERHSVKLGFMSFFVKASIEALRRYPVLNASLDETDIVYHEFFDIGVAVSTDRGLIVPILRNAEAMNFANIEKAIGDYGSRARSGSINMDELTGGTFTITNGGIFGSLMSTPMLNTPQSGILGMHKIQQRPVVVDGEVVARPMMHIALTYDHRLVDGREAIQFLVALKDVLEDPSRLILEV